MYLPALHYDLVVVVGIVVAADVVVVVGVAPDSDMGLCYTRDPHPASKVDYIADLLPWGSCSGTLALADSAHSSIPPDLAHKSLYDDHPCKYHTYLHAA